MVTCRRSSNCYFELLGLSNALAAGRQSRIVLGSSAHILSGTPEAVGFPEACDMGQTAAVADAARALAETQLTCSSKPP